MPSAAPDSTPTGSPTGTSSSSTEAGDLLSTVVRPGRRRQRSVRVSVAVALMGLATVLVVLALPTQSPLWLSLAAVVSLGCGWASARIVYTEVVQSRREAAADRAAQAQAYREIFAERASEHAEFTSAMTERLTSRERDLAALRTDVRTAESRASAAESRVQRESRRALESDARLREADVRLREFSERLRELEIAQAERADQLAEWTSGGDPADGPRPATAADPGTAQGSRGGEPGGTETGESVAGLLEWEQRNQRAGTPQRSRRRA